MLDDSLPLVTFAVFAYRQERFIREAVEGALAQTYARLEIILSDDCSSDKTFPIMRELAAAYRGPHRIVLNRNESNLGLGRHINRVMELATGELIVAAAGDDISLPGRTAALVERWLACAKKPCSIYSALQAIDADGAPLRTLGAPPKPGPLAQRLSHFMPGVRGASHAWSRRVFDEFGPLLPDTLCEDRVIPFRSELLGGIEYLPGAWVRYRIHGNNISLYDNTEAGQILSATVKINQQNLNILLNYLADADTAVKRQMLPGDEAAKIGAVLARRVENVQHKIAFIQGGRPQKIALILANLAGDPAQALRWLAALLFPGLYVWFQQRNFFLMSGGAGEALAQYAGPLRHGVGVAFSLAAALFGIRRLQRLAYLAGAWRRKCGRPAL